MKGRGREGRKGEVDREVRGEGEEGDVEDMDGFGDG